MSKPLEHHQLYTKQNIYKSNQIPERIKDRILDYIQKGEIIIKVKIAKEDRILSVT